MRHFRISRFRRLDFGPLDECRDCHDEWLTGIEVEVVTGVCHDDHAHLDCRQHSLGSRLRKVALSPLPAASASRRILHSANRVAHGCALLPPAGLRS